MNIISTSLYGNDPRYIHGVHAQYELAKRFYPGWQFRVYVDDASKVNLPDARVITVGNSSHGAFWRFLAAFESDNNVVLFRDADSRIGPREAMAVFEWLDSGKTLHSIRDHANHVHPLMAGMIGIKGKLPVFAAFRMEEMMWLNKYYGADEEFLKDYIYPILKDDMIEHSMHEGWFGLSRQFLFNKYEFVGNGFDENEYPLYPPTDEERKGFNRFVLPESAKFSGYFR